ncbi:MAG: long-chain fatty acid--CoA ligase [Calditrichaeota bacterium]|nr:MAG: long-chain fatty acid--CoA ligase [Calditrichota bacterium]
MALASLAEMFYQTCSKKPERVGMMYKSGGSYQPITFGEMKKAVEKLAAGLASIGVKKGDKVILLSENRYEWAFSDYAILTNGAATVPVYPSLLPHQIKYIINHSDAQVVIVSNKDQFDKVREIEGELAQVKTIISMENVGASGEKYLRWSDLQTCGEGYLKDHPDYLENALKKITRDDLASIVYTSGTTGEPKGVMLTHGNFLSNVEAANHVLENEFGEEIFLSFLPLCHVFERMVGHFLANYISATIAYAESIDTVPQNLLEVRPTLMAAVPRFYEKVYARIQESLEDAPALRKKIFNWAVAVGKESLKYKSRGLEMPGGLKFKYNIADKLVFSKLKTRVGGRIKYFVSGGAPLNKEIGEFFTGAGLTILEGYGLTETSPVISVNRPKRFKFGTVGFPLENVEVKIAEDGEILARGPNVMKGYYKNEAATKEAIDPEGWFHTGDIGLFDEEGFLVITDRKKDIIVTAGGKNVAPQYIEGQLTNSRFIEQAVVIGDKRKFCSALIVPALEPLQKFAQEKGIAYSSTSQLLEHPEVIKLYEQEVAAVNKNLASYESIKKFALIEQPFTIESGELTPTLKIKRRVVEQKYADIIEKLYEDKPVHA